MNRRRFLQALGLAPIAAKTYVFFGGIYRPTATSILEAWREVDQELAKLNRGVSYTIHRELYKRIQKEYVQRVFNG